MSDLETTTPTTEPDQVQKRWPATLSLGGALLIAITMACLIVAVAYFMYWHDSNRKYDLARPGSKDNNQIVGLEDDEADTTSPVTATATKQKIDYLTKEANALNNVSAFDPLDLSDQNIQLAPTDQPEQ